MPLSSMRGFSFAGRPAATWFCAARRPTRAIVPDHKVIRQGTLRRIIADAGMTVDEFILLLR